MLRFIIQNGLLAGQEIKFIRGERQFLSIGNGHNCDINFTENGVSSFHAMIVLDSDKVALIDQASADGTFVNGKRIESVWLRDGDVVELGRAGPRMEVLIDETDEPWSQRERGIIPVEPTPREIIRHTAEHIGLFDPSHDSGRATRGGEAGCILIMIFAVFGLTVLSLTGSQLGIGVVLISGLIAFATAVLYLRIFLWLDRFDPEPPQTLAFAFAWGATISVFFSGIINDLSQAFIGDLLTGIVSAPIVEEGSKGLGVLLIALLFRKDFDSVVDGIVYGGVVALGFATMENIDYYGVSLAQGGASSLIGTFVIRGVLAPFSHVLFTSMTGIGCGIARETHSLHVKLIATTLGILGAMLLHALWNALASFGSGVFLTGYLLLQMPLFIGFILTIAHLVRREGRILRKTLAPEVERGLLSPQQLEIAISVFRRTEWLASAIGNAKLFDARRRFLRAVAKLGLCHWHQARAAEARRDTGSLTLISQLQAEVFALRDMVG
jgi:RsiW-degrading membrane proteinase PrsW (M82 family)